MTRLASRTPALTLTLTVLAHAAISLLSANCLDTPVLADPTGDTTKVPDDYPTIEATIEAATDGDMILVAEGTGPENLTAGIGVFVCAAEAKDPGGTSQRQQNLRVVSPATATPAPSPAPDSP